MRVSVEDLLSQPLPPPPLSTPSTPRSTSEGELPVLGNYNISLAPMEEVLSDAAQPVNNRTPDWGQAEGLEAQDSSSAAPIGLAAPPPPLRSMDTNSGRVVIMF